MLDRLTVANLAVVETAEIDFGPGLNVITGETGAGKSVLMGALSLALGARADSSTVRDGAKEAVVEAVFDGGDLRVRRVIPASGGGRTYVNGEPATVQSLKTLAHALVEVHGPNDQQRLVDTDFQRSLTDAYGKVNLKAYEAAWSSLSALRAEKTALEADSDEGVEEETERLEFAVEELDKAGLSEADDEDLAARHAAAAHAADILEHANAATEALGGDSDATAAAALQEAVRHLREVARYHAAAAGWADEAEKLVVAVEELSRTVADDVSRLDADPEALAELDARLSLVAKLKRKYRAGTAVELLSVLERKRKRLDDLAHRAERLAEIDAQIAAAEKDVRRVGSLVTAARTKAAKKIGAAVTEELHGLGFLKSGFTVEISPAEPSATGCDAVRCWFEPNPGEKARPLDEIASTGEIARVMLAVKAVVAEADGVPVLVFDEIDSNVGGEAGHAVGEKLRAVAAHRQVIAITHLPQSAVWGDRHFAVSKCVVKGRTVSSIRALEGNARRDEIARMLDGEKASPVVLRHAEELLDRAARLRRV